jgi:hypothetical protein
VRIPVRNRQRPRVRARAAPVFEAQKQKQRTTGAPNDRFALLNLPHGPDLEH